VYTREAWDAQADRVMREPAMRRRGKHLRWAFFSRSHETELDRQNRILVPAGLRASAELGGTVLIIGTGECLEIWSPEAYAAEMAVVDEQLEITLESVETREP
jgi:MraZ protein